VSEGAWDDYIETFHLQRPGITEDVLLHARAGSRTPYDWAIDALGAVDPVVVDVACGSAPLYPRLHSRGWVGMDQSAAELGRAAERDARPLLRSQADATPIMSESAGAALCSMALMIVHPLDVVMMEVARVLRAGGIFIALVPDDGPLTLSDRVRYARLLVALRRRRLSYPNDGRLRDSRALLSRAGLQLVSDERCRFVCPITDSSVAVACVRSLYLPGEEPHRIAAAERVAQHWVGSELGLPLRRIVAMKPGRDG
jgi:SAM-dependent methyltransferase